MTIADSNATPLGMDADGSPLMNLPEATRHEHASILPIGGRRITASHAARELGCSSDTVIRRIKDKSLKGFRIGDRYYTTDAWLTTYFLRNNKTLRQKTTSKDRSVKYGAPSVEGVNDTHERGGC